MHAQRIQKLITFSPQLYSLLEKKAGRLGLSFPEYVRVLIVNDVKEEVEREAVYMVDEETEKSIGRSLRDVKENRYTIINDEDTLVKHLKSL